MVSVIIPNYNHAQYLDERIQSVLNQTYQDFEVIILDDSSSDNSLEIINKYKDNPHISKIVVNEKNCGSPFKQWRKGFELAKGEIIWIAESDDTCDTHLLEILIKAISQRDDCVIAFCKIQSFDEEGNKWISTPPQLKEGIYESIVFLSEFLSWHPTIVNASGAIFKKDTAMNIDTEYTTFKGAGDRLFWTKMAEYGSIAYTESILDYCRRHLNNATTHSFKYGLNQHDDKLILDYIFKKAYISKNKYNKIRRDYIRQRVLTISDNKIRYYTLKIWEPNIFKRLSLMINKRYKSIKWMAKHYLLKHL